MKDYRNINFVRETGSEKCVREKVKGYERGVEENNIVV